MDNLFSTLYLDKVAIKDSNENEKTYRQLYAEAKHWEEIMGRRNLVCVVCDKSLETAGFLFEMLVSGQVLMLLPADIDKSFLERLLGEYQASYIWCAGKMPGRGEICAGFPGHTLYRLAARACELHPELALLLSTSGSAGSPKMVRLGYGNLRYNMEYSVKRHTIVSEHKGISVLPLHHIWGLQFCLWHWYVGAQMLVTEESVMSREFQLFFTRERVNNIAGVPFIFQMLDRVRFWDGDRLRNLHAAMCGGSRLQKEEQDRLALLMKEKFWSEYGQTESTGALISCNFERQERKQGVIGTPLEGSEAFLDGGELVLRGRGVCLGYACGCADLKKGDENRGLLYTGDIATVDEDGFFYLGGRKKRFVKILGERISLDEVETILGQQQKNCEFACTGDTDALDVYYVGEQQEKTEKACRSVLSGRLHIPSGMLRFHQREELPRSESGKILYWKLTQEG